MLGRHAVKHWSSTQTSIALSSGEAEFAGVIRGSGQGLGYQALLKDLGVTLPLRVWTDSSAAIGICTRQGLGKLRHLDTHTLWIQQAVRTGRVDLRKVLGESNPADLLTKHSLSRQRLDNLVTLFGCRHSGGRAESAPQIRKGGPSKTIMAQADKDICAARWLSAVLEGVDPSESTEEETPPLMPHLAYPPSELGVLYPGLQAPEDGQLDDAQNDAQDGVYQAGLRIADGIRLENQTQGRKRRPET